MVETAILSQWMHRENLDLTYARWKDKKEGEVDLVLLDDRKFQPLWAIEIKWSNRYFDKPQELSSLIQFCNANDFKSTSVTSIDKEGVKEIGNLRITFVPSALYAFNIGENTLKMKNTSY